MKNFRYIILLIALFSVSGIFAAVIWVSTDGNDRYPGSKNQPKLTLQAAVKEAREMRRMKQSGIENGINIILKEGIYNLYEPVYIRAEDSGTKESPTIIRGNENSKVSISGGVKISGWKKLDRFWVADVPDFNGRPLEFRQLWINGRKAVRARDVADFEKMHRIIDNDPENEILWVPTKAVQSILNAPYPEMVLHQMWAISNLRIKSIAIHGDSAAVRFHNPESKIQFIRPWPSPMTTEGHKSPFYLTNAIALVDQPGEWFHDIKTKKLYYLPLPNEEIMSLEAIVPAIETLIQIEGTLDRPVENIFFENINFNHTTWLRPTEKGHVPLQAGMYLTEAYRIAPKMKRPDNNHDLDNQGWLGRPAAAILIRGTENINFEKCNFEHLASSGLDYEWGNKGGKIEGCVFRDIGGNGLVVGSFSPAALETHLPYNPSDKREVCSHQIIINNLFENVTNEDWGCIGIAAGYVNNIDISHNEIREVSYTGISLGWGWNRSESCMHSNRIHANHIWKYARHMYDVSGIYTLGMQPNTMISENYVHSIYTPGYVHIPSHWFYLYTDEGSSYITVKNNWTESEKFLQNANGPGNIWENNGPFVKDSVKRNAGPKGKYEYLKNKE
ncbi:MAG: right-handed parallel beta-helix repeat-containing protein [Porphyromonadaceae bacterium]|nr:right-handed parallel beta-helix repeat-containing protein [Porphyromonadaceae bacterium]